MLRDDIGGDARKGGHVPTTADVHGRAMNRRPPRAGEKARPQAGADEPVEDFALTLARDGRGTAVLVLAGELDLYRARELEDAFERAIGPLAGSEQSEPTFDERSGHRAQTRGDEVRRLAVDVRSVTFIDSTMLALLLAASRRQHARGGELVVLVGPQTPMTAFKVTGFDRLLAIRWVDARPHATLKLSLDSPPRELAAGLASSRHLHRQRLPRPPRL